MIIANLLTNFQTYHNKDKQKDSLDKSANEIVAFSSKDDALLSPYFTLERSDDDKSLRPLTYDGKGPNGRDPIVNVNSVDRDIINQDLNFNATYKSD